jgi:hypothetical protein
MMSDVCPASCLIYKVKDISTHKVGKPKQVRQFGNRKFVISSETQKPKQLCCVSEFWKVANSKLEKCLNQRHIRNSYIFYQVL